MSRIQPSVSYFRPMQAIPRLATFKPMGADVVLFGRNANEFETGGYTYTVLGGSEAEGREALPKLLEARLQAATKQQSTLRNPTNDNDRHYGAMLVFDNGQESASANIALLRQRFRCDVDIALHAALRAWMTQNISGQTPTPRVTSVYLAGADPSAPAPVPCEDCYEWFNTDIFLPETKVYKLEENPAKHRATIEIHTIQDILPLHKGRQSMSQVTEKPIDTIPIQLSPAAEKVLAQIGPSLTAQRIRRLMQQAKKAYEFSEQAFPTIANKHAGAAVIVSPFTRMTVTSSRFEWARRWVGYPDLTAAQEAFQKIAQWQMWIEKLPALIRKPFQRLLAVPKIQAVAYYGNDPAIPTIGGLGRLRRHRGSEDTLILTIEDDTLQVHTMGDYLPITYQTPSILRNGHNGHK